MTAVTESTSKVNITSTTKEYKQFEDEQFQYDIIDLDAVQKVISEIPFTLTLS